MNINNYSYDDNYGKNSKKIKFKPIQIIIIINLIILFTALALVYKGLKKNVEEKQSIETNAPDDRNFISELDVIGNLYGFSFTLYVSGDNGKIDFLGDYIPTFFLTNNYTISGQIWKSGADIYICEGTEQDEYSGPEINIIINSDGVFCSTDNIRYFVYPEEEFIKGSDLPNTYIRVADGVRGEELIQGICGYFDLLKSQKNISLTYEEDNTYKIEVPENITQEISSNSNMPFLSDLTGNTSFTLKATYNADQLRNFVLQGGDSGINIIFEATEIQYFSKPPYVNYYMSTDDFLGYVN